MADVSIGPLEAFRATRGGWVEGELLGLGLVIGRLPQLRELKLEVPLLVAAMRRGPRRAQSEPHVGAGSWRP